MKLTEEQKQQNKLARAEAKELAKIENEKNQKLVKEIIISIEWKKSYMWGNCPRCKAEIRFKDGSYERSPKYTAFGCGYDKESTVVAHVFNDYLKYKLYNNLTLVEGKTSTPYGIRCDEWKSYEGGLGINCYYSISKAINGNFEHVASGKTFDVYKYTDNN